MMKNLVFHNPSGKLRKKFVNYLKNFIHRNVDKGDNSVENVCLYRRFLTKRESIQDNLWINL
jgi:hypothetical protein